MNMKFFYPHIKDNSIFSAFPFMCLLETHTAVERERERERE